MKPVGWVVAEVGSDGLGQVIVCRTRELAEKCLAEMRDVTTSWLGRSGVEWTIYAVTPDDPPTEQWTEEMTTRLDEMLIEDTYTQAHVDLGSLPKDRVVTCPAKYAVPGLLVGQRITVGDGMGLTAQAVVLGVGEVLTLRVIGKVLGPED